MSSLTFRLIIVLTVLWGGVESIQFVNVALKKPARHNNDFWGLGADRAVDGNNNNNLNNGGCTHTSARHHTWLVIDFLTPYPVHSVKIYKRWTDPHLVDFYVYVSKNNPIVEPLRYVDAMPGELCFWYEDIFPNAPTTIPCKNVITGRYLYFWKKYNDKLCICEVEVLVEEKYVNSIGQRLHNNPPQLSIKKNWKSTKTSFISKIISRPFRSLVTQCAVFCFSMTSPARYTTVLQVDTKTGMCECIEKSNMVENPGNEENGDWILVELTSN